MPRPAAAKPSTESATAKVASKALNNQTPLFGEQRHQLDPQAGDDCFTRTFACLELFLG